MSEWKEYRLGEIADVSTGFAFKGGEYEFKGKLRAVRGENVTIGNLRWDSEKFWNKPTKGLEQYFLDENDIVVGMDGSRVGHNRAKIKKQELPLILAQRVARLRAKTHFDQNFLWYHIFSDNFKEYVEAVHTGTSIPHISQKQIADFVIIVPTLKMEQIAIASILSSLDDKIALLQRQNTALKEMTEILFRKWFVKKAKNDWKGSVLSDLVIVKYGKDHKKLIDGNVPVYGSGGIMRYVDRHLYSLESVLIPRKGTLNNVMYQDEPFWTVDTMFYTEMRKPNVAKFVYHFLKAQDLASMNVGSAVPSMTTDILNNMALDMPPSNTLKRFDNAVSPLYKKIKSNQTQTRALTALRDTLLPKLMSGEVRLIDKHIY